VRRRPQREPQTDRADDGEAERDQSPCDASPRRDCFSTRQPVAKTVRR
jgi:hypothetical protein